MLGTSGPYRWAYLSKCVITIPKWEKAAVTLPFLVQRSLHRKKAGHRQTSQQEILAQILRFSPASYPSAMSYPAMGGEHDESKAVDSRSGNRNDR